MERSFIVSKDSEYSQQLDKYCELANQQRKFVKEFFNEKGIEAQGFLVTGDGFMNVPFDEDSKNDISLGIIPSDNDLTNFKKFLTKPKDQGLCYFKKNSSIAKEFAQKCVDSQVVINLYSPKPRDYFESLGYERYGYSQFTFKDILYIKIKSEYLKSDDTPEGFTEIKLSEFYRLLEEYEIQKQSK